jgi:hypothetical protein
MKLKYLNYFSSLTLVVILFSNTLISAPNNSKINVFKEVDTLVNKTQQKSLPLSVLKKVEKNILLYRLIKRHEEEVDECDDILMKWEYFTTDLIAKNQKLILYTERLDTLNFPKKGYRFYLVRNDNLASIDTIKQIIHEKSSSHSSLSEVYLIAFNEKKPKDEQLLFISGNFYKNAIYHMYNTKKGELSSIKEMVKMRYFVNQIDKVDLIKITKKHFIFRLKSSKINSSSFIYIKVDKENHYKVSNVTYEISDKRRKRWQNKKSISDRKYAAEYK